MLYTLCDLVIFIVSNLAQAISTYAFRFFKKRKVTDVITLKRKIQMIHFTMMNQQYFYTLSSCNVCVTFVVIMNL